MSNSRGQAAWFAYNPEALCAFIQHKTQYVEMEQEFRVNGGRRRWRRVTKRLVNGIHFDQSSDARMVLRWRTTTKGVTHHSATRVLSHYNLTTAQFERWAKAHGMKPILWER